MIAQVSFQGDVIFTVFDVGRKNLLEAFLGFVFSCHHLVGDDVHQAVGGGLGQLGARRLDGMDVEVVGAGMVRISPASRSRRSWRLVAGRLRPISRAMVEGRRGRRASSATGPRMRRSVR